MTSCPPPELLQAFSAGVLSPRLEARVRDHVARCAVCRTLGAALDDPSVGDLTPEERDRIERRLHSEIERARGASRRRTWRWAATAAAVVMLAVVGSRVMRQEREAEPSNARGVTPEAASAAAPSAFLLPPLSSLRGSANPRRQPAPPPAERAQLADALHLGVSQMHLERDAIAVATLESAEALARATDPSLSRPANWYLALAYARTGQFDLARARLKTLCDSPGEFALLACAGIQELSGVYRLSGTVTDLAGNPVADATVGQYVTKADGDQMVLYRTPFSSRTDAAGRYSISGVPVPRGRSIVVRASKRGYFTAAGAAALSPEMRASFRMAVWTGSALDSVVKGTLGKGDAGCPGVDLCRQFGVSAPRAGTLDVSLVTDVREKMDVWIETPDGSVHSPLISAPLRVAIPVVAQAAYQITIVNWGPEPRTFELTMQWR